MGELRVEVLGKYDSELDALPVVQQWLEYLKGPGTSV